MAYTTVDKSTDFFNTITYSNAGDGAKAVTGAGHQPDLVWIKNRGSAYHGQIHDAVRGASAGALYTSTAVAQDSGYGISSFDSDGFTTGSQSSNISQNSASQVAWNWKAGTTSGLSGGTITPSAYSINTTSKIGIYAYTGNGSGSQTIAHGLGATPTCVMFKQTSGTEQWRVHFMKAPNPYTAMFFLNSDVAESSQSNGLSAVSSTTITFGSDGAYNLNGSTYVCYVFCDVPGFSKMGTYTGNGNANGAFVYTGFKPNFFMIKRTTQESWIMTDSKRGYPQSWNYLLADATQTESAGGLPYDFVSNGIKFRGTTQNESGSTYMFMAFGQSLVGSNNVPCTGR